MKKYLFILLAAVAFVACSNDEPDNGYSGDNMETSVIVCDAADIKGRYVFPLAADELRMLRRNPNYFEESWKEAHPHAADSLSLEIKNQTMGYDNMRLLFHIALPDETPTYNKEQLESSRQFYDLVRNAQRELRIPQEELSEINRQRSLHGEELLSGSSIFFTARFSGPVIITADKPLFGTEAGQDLSAHFGVEGAANLLPQGTLEDYSIRFEKFAPRPTAVADFFASDTWLMRNYVFWMKDIPEETYDEVTFTITLPVTCDYWRDYFAYKLPEMEHETRMLTASATVYFGQKSNFEGEELILWAVNSPTTLWWY